MKKVGILVGREQTFPEALIRNINERGKGEVTAEFMKLGGIRHDEPPRSGHRSHISRGSLLSRDLEANGA